MSQPLYFLPGTFRNQLVSQNGDLSPAVLSARGIAAVFADVRAREFYACDVTKGPGDHSGVMLAYQAVDGNLPNTKYAPHHQSWQEVAAGLWIGIDNDSPPKPDDLRRSKTVAGYTLEFDNGTWTIPIIRRKDESTNLPRDIRLHGGIYSEPVKSAYRKYWEASEEVAGWFFANGWRDDNKVKGVLLALEALSINYRVGIHEQNAFGVVDTDSYMSVLMCSVDVPGARVIEDAEKKTESSPDAPNSTPGFADSPPPTNPVAENSTPLQSV